MKVQEVEDPLMQKIRYLDKLVDELATCRYLESATNVLLIGPPGVGKTHCETPCQALTP